MKRVNSSRAASEIVFIDSSGGMDRIGTRVFIIMAQTVVGGVPIGVVLVSSEAEAVIQQGFTLFKVYYIYTG